MSLASVALAFSMSVLASTAAPSRSPTTPAKQQSLGGDTTIDLGSNQHLKISKDGALWLDDDILLTGSVGLDPQANTLAYRLTRDRVTVALGIRIPHMQEPDTVVLAEIDLLNDRLEWSAIVRPPTLYHDKGTSWQAIFGDDYLLLQREHVLVAVDMRTGTQAWSFASADPTFEEHYRGGLGIEKGEIVIEKVRVRGRDVVIDGKRRKSYAPLHVELDLATGRRIHVDDAPKLEPQPLFDFSMRRPPPAYDDQPPPPPDRPAGYDGVIVGYTTLVWNTTTAKGMIVNPTASALGDIVAVARTQTVEAKDGSKRPIEWLVVLDTGVLATEMVVGKAPKPKKPLAPTIFFDYDDGLQESGEVVDADSLGAALGIPVVRSRVDLRELPPEVRVQQREWGSIDVVFGPLAFHDDTQRWTERHVSRD